MVERDQHGSASTRDEPNNLSNLHYCLRKGCLGELTQVEGDHDNLVIHYECERGHSGSKCITELAG